MSIRVSVLAAFFAFALVGPLHAEESDWYPSAFGPDDRIGAANHLHPQRIGRARRHEAGSLLHDMIPARDLGFRCLWINRLGEERPGWLPAAQELPDLTRVPEIADP